MVAQRKPERMNVEEWRALQRANPDTKYEYIDGQVYFMSGGSLAHARIGSDEHVELTSLGISLPVAVIYRGTTVPIAQIQ